jgi:hypothetical protein
MSTEMVVETPHGEGRLVTARARKPVATLLLGHGAGNGIEARDLEALAHYLPRNGVSVVRFEQPWRRAGRKVATAPATLDEALIAADPEKYFTEPHYYGYPAVLVRLANVPVDELEELLIDAWRCMAPRALVKEYDAAQST